MKTLIAAGLAILVTGCFGSPPGPFGTPKGMFPPCPATPNCVSSQATDDRHAIEPISYSGTPEAARTRLLAVLQGMKRTRVVRSDEHYLRAEFTSAVFRFVDDGEFYIVASPRIIHVRSASRVGYSDFGVNRKRVEEIRKRFREAAP